MWVKQRAAAQCHHAWSLFEQRFQSSAFSLPETAFTLIFKYRRDAGARLRLDLLIQIDK